MTDLPVSVADELNALIRGERISSAAVAAVTGLSADRVADLLSTHRASGPELDRADPGANPTDGARIAILTAMLGHGLDIDEGFRLQEIIRSLIAEYHFELENIARLTGVSGEDIQLFLEDSHALEPTRKFTLAMRVSYLTMMITNVGSVVDEGEANGP